MDGAVLSCRHLQQLEVLRLEHNRFTGTFPVEVTTFPRLSSLYLAGNMLSCELPNFDARFLKQVCVCVCVCVRACVRCWWHDTIENAHPSCMWVVAGGLVCVGSLEVKTLMWCWAMGLLAPSLPC